MALRYCKKGGCHKLTKGGYCRDHSHLEDRDKAEANKRYDENRPNFRQRGYNHQWTKVRKMHLAEYPWCQECNRDRAVIVHHIKSAEQHPELMYHMDNLQGVCRGCHNRLHGRKSATL
jgi:5-methylcytosine-specific restriction protein A